MYSTVPTWVGSKRPLMTSLHRSVVIQCWIDEVMLRSLTWMYPTAPQANKNPFRFLGLRLWAHFLVRRTVCSFKNQKMYCKAVELLACLLTKTLGPHASTQNVLFAEWWLWGIGWHKTCVLSKAEWGWQTEFVDPKYPFVSGLVGRMHFVDSHAWLRFITCYNATCFAGSLWLKKNGSHLKGLCLLGADTVIRRLSCATWKAPTPQGARGLLLIQLVISFTALEPNWWTDGIVCGVLRRCLLGLLILYSGRWQNGVLIVPLRLTAWHRMTLWRPTHRNVHRVTEKERNNSCMEV